MAPHTRMTRETEHILREDKKMPVQLSSAQEIEGETRPTERSEQVTNGGIVHWKETGEGRKSHRTAGRQLYRSRNPTPYQMPAYTAPMAVARKTRVFRKNRCTTRLSGSGERKAVRKTWRDCKFDVPRVYSDGGCSWLALGGSLKVVPTCPRYSWHSVVPGEYRQ
jgi:hypothetical protein